MHFSTKGCITTKDIIYTCTSQLKEISQRKKRTKKTSSFWIITYERKEEEKEGEEVRKNWSYGKEDNIIYEVGFS